PVAAPVADRQPHATPWMSGASVEFTQQLVWGPLGHLRVTTVRTAAVTFAMWSWTSRRPLWAAVGTMAWSAVFEVFYYTASAALAWAHGSGARSLAAVAGSPLESAVWPSLAVAGWILLGYMQGFRPSRGWLLAAGVAAALWWVTGFHRNVWLSPATFDPLGEILNVATKTLVAAAYLAGTTSPPRAPSIDFGLAPTRNPDPSAGPQAPR
ncbi:MAG: hypothetical protein ACYDBQ_10035, partial [Thermoplasmatota archaeon]